MEDSYFNVSRTRLITLALWTWTLTVLAAAWVAFALGHLGLFHALGFTACASSAVAATAQIRCYAVNLCTQIRAAGLVNEARVRSLH